MTRKLLQEIESANKRHGLIQKNDSLIVTVSGGPDSIALLALLLKLRRKYSLKLAIAHLDHGIHPSESKRFLSFVQKISQRIDLPLYSKSVAVGLLARKRKRSIEETGRIERYQFFEEVAAKISRQKSGLNRLPKIVTAHTLDDQAETLLMRIFRGTGLRGLTGIPYKRKQGAFEIIRPLLGCGKKDLLAFLKENHIGYLVDKSNQSDLFTRNRIRHHFLPKIAKQFNPNIKQSLSGLQSICSDAQDFLDKTAQKAFRQCQAGKLHGKKISLEIPQLKKLHPAIAREVLLKAFEKAGCDLRRLTSSHIEAALAILNSRERKEVHLPGPATACVGGRDSILFLITQH